MSDEPIHVPDFGGGVLAMFYVEEVGYRPNDVGVVKLRAVAKGPYAEWSKWTPSGTIEITTLNEHATEWYRKRIGQDIEVRFSDPTAEPAPSA